MGSVTLFTYLFTCLTSPWRCHEIKYTLCMRFWIGNQTHFSLAAPTNKQPIAPVKALQYQLGLCQYLWKSREQQTKQSTEVSDNEMRLFHVRDVPTISISIITNSGGDYDNITIHMKQYSICINNTFYLVLDKKNLIYPQISLEFGNFNDQNTLNLSKNVSF